MPDSMMLSKTPLSPAFIEPSQRDTATPQGKQSSHQGKSSMNSTVVLDLRSRRFREQDRMSRQSTQLSLSREDLATYRSSRTLPRIVSVPMPTQGLTQQHGEHGADCMQLSTDWTDAVTRMDAAINAFLESKPVLRNVEPDDARNTTQVEPPWYTSTALPPTPVVQIKQHKPPKIPGVVRLSSTLSKPEEMPGSSASRKDVPSLSEARKQPSTPSFFYQKFVNLKK